MSTDTRDLSGNGLGSIGLKRPKSVIVGDFAATGQSEGLLVNDKANIQLAGTFVATVLLEKSFDNSNWLEASKNSDGDAASYTGPIGATIQEVGEGNVWYRWNCSTLTSGSVNFRLSTPR